MKLKDFNCGSESNEHTNILKSLKKLYSKMYGKEGWNVDLFITVINGDRFRRLTVEVNTTLHDGVVWTPHPRYIWIYTENKIQNIPKEALRPAVNGYLLPPPKVLRQLLLFFDAKYTCHFSLFPNPLHISSWRVISFYCGRRLLQIECYWFLKVNVYWEASSVRNNKHTFSESSLCGACYNWNR